MSESHFGIYDSDTYFDERLIEVVFSAMTLPDTDIAELSGLGPKSQEMLARAGITSAGQLRQLGSVEAYVRTKQANPGASLNLLWALEGTLTGISWQEVARLHRTSLLLAVEELERRR